MLSRLTAAVWRPLNWWLCRVGAHDWRNMDGVCAECGHHDPMWSADRHL